MSPSLGNRRERRSVDLDEGKDERKHASLRLNKYGSKQFQIQSVDLSYATALVDHDLR
jgi:hypothetical protein